MLVFILEGKRKLWCITSSSVLLFFIPMYGNLGRCPCAENDPWIVCLESRAFEVIMMAYTGQRQHKPEPKLAPRWPGRQHVPRPLRTKDGCQRQSSPLEAVPSGCWLCCWQWWPPWAQSTVLRVVLRQVFSGLAAPSSPSRRAKNLLFSQSPRNRRLRPPSFVLGLLPSPPCRSQQLALPFFLSFGALLFNYQHTGCSTCLRTTPRLLPSTLRSSLGLAIV